MPTEAGHSITGQATAGRRRAGYTIYRRQSASPQKTPQQATQAHRRAHHIIIGRNTSPTHHPHWIRSASPEDGPQALRRRSAHHTIGTRHIIASHHATRIMHARYRELHHARIYRMCASHGGSSHARIYIGLHHAPTHAHDTLIQ